MKDVDRVVSIGQRIRERRENLGWTQKFAAQKVGKTQSTYAGYENEMRTPPTEMMPIIAEKFDTTLDYLYGLVDDPERTLRERDIEEMTEERVLQLMGIDYKNEAKLMTPSRRKAVVDFYKFQLYESLRERNENESPSNNFNNTSSKIKNNSNY